MTVFRTGATVLKVAVAGILTLTLLGCDEQSEPEESAGDDPIRIGFGMALTGALAGNGKAALVAMQIWEEDVNAKGGLLGRPVELVHYDDQTNPSTVPTIYSKLIDLDEVDFVVSGYGSTVIAPAIPIVMSKGMVFPALFGLATNEQFEYQNYFQILPAGPDPVVGWSSSFFELAAAMDPKPATVALVGADAEFPAHALEGARVNAAKAGLEIVYDETYPPRTVDFSSIVRAISAAEADVVYVASYPPDSAGIVRAVQEVGLQADLFGGGMVGLQYASLMESLGPMLNGIVNYHFWVPEPSLAFPGIEAFIARYQERAADEGVDPLGHYLPPWAYAYLQLLETAIRETGSLDQATVAEYLRTNTIDTLVGPIRFGRNGEWAESRILMIQYRGLVDGNLAQFERPGTQVVLYPEEYRSGDHVYPYADNEN